MECVDVVINGGFGHDFDKDNDFVAGEAVKGDAFGRGEGWGCWVGD